ncbi:MAG TPA: bifunctional methylenetetrahydrofolate dehydrogenase/methenyltetrahydrofolate cyclohydrolase FolD [Nitrospirales bacterium]|nr:bifunctional methylenetetrahydrofolate dehydrogenase/methenyltetrahydrofolate cyclohydrolase FolD [Nitrospirales bacterium]
MAAQIIDGKALAQAIRTELREQAAALQVKGVRPGLSVFLVGDDPASALYVRNKHKACESVGVFSEEQRLPATLSQDELINLVKAANANPKIHGILVQLPLPDHIDKRVILETIAAEKDVDGFHPYNMGLEGNPRVVACTPKGVVKMIESTGISIEGKRAVVVGRSQIVGKPAAMLLLERHATVTICHSRTQDLGSRCREADILIVAAGKARMIGADMVKPGAVVIDVGMNLVDKGFVGDVDFESVSEVAGWISPVPGGVGPMTIAMLLENTVEAAARAAK